MRKKISVLIIAIIMIVGSFASCGGGGASTTEYYGTYTEDVTTLVPFNLPNTTGKKVIANTVDGLIETDIYGKYVPAIAESWEHNEDYTVWTFHLREGVNWYDSSGQTVREVVAQDFVDGLKYVADHKKTKSDMSIIKTVIVGLEEYYDTLVDFDDTRLPDSQKPEGTRDDYEKQFEEIVGVKAIDDYTLQYTLTQPTSYFESFLLTELFLPNNKEFSDELGTKFGTSPENLLYCGAYYLETWQRNKQFVLVKNQEYYDADKVSVETIILQKVDDAATVEMFQRGELTSANIDGAQVEYYMEDDEWGQYVTLKEKSSVNYWFTLNFESPNSEFDAFVTNEDFRKAIYHAMDRETYAELFNPYDAVEMLINTIAPNDVCIDENGKDYTDYEPLLSIKERGETTYNQDTAREYFDKAVAAVTDGNGNITEAVAGEVQVGRQMTVNLDGKLPLQLVYIHESSTDDVALAQLIKINLEEVLGKENIEVILSPITGEKYNDVIAPGYFDLAYDNFSFKYADPLAQLERLVTGGAINDGKYVLPEFDTLVAEAAEKLNPSERYEIFAQAEAMLIEGGYIIPWESGGGVYGLTREVPFTAPRGGFGIVRFKYKGIQLQEEPVSAAQYEEAYMKFVEELKNN